MDPEQITNNPYLETCPDYGGQDYNKIRNLMTVGGQLTADVATQRLIDAWTQGNDTRKAAWDAQVAADQEAQRALEQQQREDEERRQAQREEEAKAECKAAEKKKPQMPDFDEKKAASDTIPF